MNGRPLIAVSGWAHGAGSLSGLTRLLPAAAGGARYDLGQLAAAGGSSRDGGYAAGLIRIIERAGAPAVLMGWSTGGIVALEAAVRRPDLVGGLILLGTCARYCNGEDYDAGVPEKNLRALMVGLSRRPETTLQGFFEDCAHPAALSAGERGQAVGEALRFGARELQSGLEYLRRCDLRAELRGLEAPALVLHGEEDRVVPLPAAMDLREVLPEARLRTLPGAGHAFPVQVPERAVGPTAAFLEELR